MPSKTKSPYGTAFKAAIKNGTPCGTIVNTICHRTGKPVTTIYQSLYKAGLCFRVKFNGQWIYWPTFVGKKASVNACNACQTTMWQCFIDWCLACGCCTPGQLNSNSNNQKSFMSFCRSYFGRQFNGALKGHAPRKIKSKSLTKSRSKTYKPKTRWTAHSSKKWTKRWTKNGSRASSYTFPSFKSRRYTKAA